MSVDPMSTTTGPVQRIWSNPHTSSAFGQQFGTYAYGMVELPCRNGNLRTGDSGQIYFGGDSANSGSSIDAGLQYNYNAATHPSDDYGLYIRATSNPYNYGYFEPGEPGGFYYFTAPNAWQNSPGVSFSCGQSVLLQYTLDETAPTSVYGQNVTFVISAMSPAFTEWFVVIIPGTTSYYGWSNACDGCNLKRATGLAQSGSAPLSYDFFNTVWSGVKISCGFNGYSCPTNGSDPDWDASTTFGCDEYPYWDGGYSLGDCHNSPTGATVSVNQFAYNFENISIVYTPPVGSGSLPTYGNTSYPGVTYAASATGTTSDIALNLAITNTNSTPITLGEAAACPWADWHAMGITNNTLIESFAFPENDLCEDHVVSESVQPGGTIDLGSVHWLGSHTAQWYSWEVSSAQLGIGEGVVPVTGPVSFTSTLSSISASGKFYVNGGVPTPTPIKTPTPVTCGGGRITCY